MKVGGGPTAPYAASFLLLVKIWWLQMDYISSHIFTRLHDHFFICLLRINTSEPLLLTYLIRASLSTTYLSAKGKCCSTSGSHIHAGSIYTSISVYIIIYDNWDHISLSPTGGFKPRSAHFLFLNLKRCSFTRGPFHKT